jgi:adenylyl cyclase-associated protein
MSGDLFAALSKGESVTSGLKKVIYLLFIQQPVQSLFDKVDDSLKTHKNPELRASGSVPDKAPVVVTKTAVAKAPAIVKPPRFELQDKKWVVENQVMNFCCAIWSSCMMYCKWQVDNTALEIAEGNIKQTVYLQNCSGKANRTVLQVKTKVNSIMIDGCSKTSLVVHRCILHVF